MATSTVGCLDDAVYEGLTTWAAMHHQSMETAALAILPDDVRRRQRWQGAVLADLSGDLGLSQIDTPYVRSTGLPRDVPLMDLLLDGDT